jgi:hypothetical protein
MQLTLFGFALLPLCAAAILQPVWQLQLVLLAGAFGAAAPLVIGGYGLPPGVVPAALFLSYVALQFFLGARFPAADRAWRTLEPFMLMAAYALVTALLVPRLFAGSFTVWPQKLAPPFDVPVLLQPSMSNVTQSFYLLLDTAVLVGVALHLGRSRADPLRLLYTYLGCGFVVVAICGWQLAQKLTGIWFPEAFLYSNPGWAIFPGQTMGIVPRINGPFSEPAALAYYLSGPIFCCTWLALRGHRNRVALALLPFAVLALLLSTSTTGFAVLSVGGVVLLVYGLTRAPRLVARRIFAVALPLAALAVAGAVAMSTLSARVEESIAVVTQQSLVKAHGDSFINRTGLDMDSLGVLFPSFGLGAGWGSQRASSLMPGLLANLGIYGCALLLWFIVRLVRQVGRARRLAATSNQLMALDGLSAALIGHVTAALISAPALNAADLYVLLGALIACAARVEAEAGLRARGAVTARAPALPA